MAPAPVAGAELLPADATRHAGSFWLPPEGATFTGDVDWLFYAILGLTVVCFAGISIAVVALTWRYRSRPGHRAQASPAHSDALEITWTVIPSVICVLIFFWGWQGFVNINTPPENAMTVEVRAQKWKWLYKHEGLDLDVPELHVPVGKPVRLVMRSADVLHSFYVPAFRTKADVIPYRYTFVWFEATQPGTYRMYCAEYCGTDHSNMKTVVVVHGPRGVECEPGAAESAACCDLSRDPLGVDCSYAQWRDGYIAKIIMSRSPAERGELFVSQLGCRDCHSIDGTAGKGPTFQGIWGSMRETNVGPARADENFIRESILDPQAKIRAGFGPIMPTFKGKLDDERIDWIIAYLRTLK